MSDKDGKAWRPVSADSSWIRHDTDNTEHPLCTLTYQVAQGPGPAAFINEDVINS